MAIPENEAVTNFRNYLRVPSVHPNVNYDACVQFLKDQAKSLQLPVNIYNIVDKKPVVIITLKGEDPSLPSILLNSHMDVVPVFREMWNYDPFGAEKLSNGNIYARGSQDMKCVGIQYIETVRRYLAEGLKFKRTIHMSFVPDEEVGGIDGMSKFIDSDYFKQLNVGFALDEGVASPTEDFKVFYAERAIWHLKVICPGTAGHGSVLHENTAGEKVRYIVDKFMDYREKEKQKLNSNPNLLLGDVTTINLTQLEGGVQVNVVPPEFQVTFDVRLAMDVDHVEFEGMLRKWCAEAGEGTELEFSVQNKKMGLTKLDDRNLWWTTFKAQSNKLGLKLTTAVFPGGTDCRFIRNVGIPAIGFSPMNNTPVLLHDHNEYLNEAVFLRGIDIYYGIIQHLANV